MYYLYLKNVFRSSRRGSVVNKSAKNHEVVGSIPGLAQWVKDPALPVSCGVVHRHGSDPELLWLWSRTVATAPIRPLAWEPPYATGVALKKDKRQKNPKKSRIHMFNNQPKTTSNAK